ncbi:uncharacterized protein BYT42DRAFT_561704 [Radiomyces spectabilis]|uniref:uncharacterized protein n=1 Tax=Radiomyces spectabilis TaxID=64574 RepID=UPI0022201E63|nr:uncharacterized protein BYT42DRAFT_561704 [Radiomyces spectabilis]KAI8388921.1 hypothetical protein BYT42DRAFT_561704 [Radiomyces spectabilis]
MSLNAERKLGCCWSLLITEPLAVLPRYAMSYKARKSILPLHIDTASFTTPLPQRSSFYRRIPIKRQAPSVILIVLLLLSLAYNVAKSHRRQPSSCIASHIDESLPPPSHLATHAIVIPGHSIFTGSNAEDLENESYWVLESFQQGQVTTFLNHIEKGIELARNDPNALLIFSGGQTRVHAGPRSEGSSYWQIAQLLLAGDPDYDTILSRSVTEEYARDSYENLLFSLCRFAEMTDQYPLQVTVVGFEFKRKRFEELHRSALRYPRARFEYIGIDPEISDMDTITYESETNNSFKPFENDFYGCKGSLLQKKIDRNPFRRRHMYRDSCPALSQLISYCPSTNSVFDGPLPWDNPQSNPQSKPLLKK